MSKTTRFLVSITEPNLNIKTLPVWQWLGVSLHLVVLLWGWFDDYRARKTGGGKHSKQWGSEMQNLPSQKSCLFQGNCFINEPVNNDPMFETVNILEHIFVYRMIHNISTYEECNDVQLLFSWHLPHLLCDVPPCLNDVISLCVLSQLNFWESWCNNFRAHFLGHCSAKM